MHQLQLSCHIGGSRRRPPALSLGRGCGCWLRWRQPARTQLAMDSARENTASHGCCLGRKPNRRFAAALFFVVCFVVLKLASKGLASLPPRFASH